MSSPDTIRALEALAALDAQLKVLEDQLTRERAALATLTDKQRALEAKLAGDRIAFSATEKMRNECFQEVRSMHQQLEASRDKLGRSRNERESNAAQRELEELRKLMRDREEDLNKLTGDANAVQLAIEATTEELKKVGEELGASEGAINTRIAGLEAERAQTAANRGVASKAVPVAIFRKYETIRQKKGSALATTGDGTCRACNMALPPQLFHRLRREPLLEQCPSCFRLIYFSATVRREDGTEDGVGGDAPPAVSEAR